MSIVQANFDNYCFFFRQSTGWPSMSTAAISKGFNVYSTSCCSFVAASKFQHQLQCFSISWFFLHFIPQWFSVIHVYFHYFMIIFYLYHTADFTDFSSVQQSNWIENNCYRYQFSNQFAMKAYIQCNFARLITTLVKEEENARVTKMLLMRCNEINDL